MTRAVPGKISHRHVARGYFKKRGGGHPSRQFNQIAAERMALCVFYNMSELSRPGLGYAWRYGIGGPMHKGLPLEECPPTILREVDELHLMEGLAYGEMMSRVFKAVADEAGGEFSPKVY